MFDYEWEKLSKEKIPKKNLSLWNSKFGPIVLNRNSDNKASLVKFQGLIDNPNIEVFLACEYNDWGKNLEILEDFKFKHDEYSNFGYLELKDIIKHKDPYKFLVKEKGNLFFREDPASFYFDDLGNSIFWDFEDPSCYIKKHTFIDTFERSTKILQTDLPGLIVHFKSISGEFKDKFGHEIDSKNMYKFIATSGVVEEIKKLGFNTIQFLPFAQNIDGDNWKFRYLVPFHFAIQKNWGNPDDFVQMIDEFHKYGIAVIGDFVLGHIPYKDYNIFGQSSDEHGLHVWSNRHGSMLYLKDKTTWETMRIDYDNSYVREFFISSCIFFMKYYAIDGFRIDNIDGIIRYGDNGDGDERPNGRTFLRELNSEIYTYNPSALIHYEAHYYYEDNAKMLVAPIDSNFRALGATCYNSSRMTYYFHTQYMFKKSDEITVWKYKHINDEKEWGKSNSTIADFHNHDAAAGLMSMRCTGSYAADSMSALGTPLSHCIGKIKVMECIISFCLEGRTLDLLQTFLLQSGTFEHDSSIQWKLLENKNSHFLVNFKSRVNEIMNDSAFWPKFVCNREYLNLDDKNKVMVVSRSSDCENYIIVINNASWELHNYKVGVKSSNKYEVVFNSDLKEYCGQERTNVSNILENKSSNNFEVLDRELEIPVLGGYTCLVLKEIKN